MKKMISSFQSVVMMVTLVTMLVGCGSGDRTVPTLISTSQPPEFNLIIDPDISDVLAGQTVTLAVEASGQGVKIKWSAIRGTLSASEGPAVVYSPPDTPGKDTVSVEVSTAAGTTIKNVSFNVIAPPIAALEPIACNHPAVTANLFPQLEGVNGQFPMYGPEGDPNILCQAVYDIVHTPGKMAVHFKYENVGTNFGWWGIAIKDPNSYDASQHSQVCFWVYAQQPNQSFHVKMKDKSEPKKEEGEVVITQATNKWEQICTDISRFAGKGIQVDKMDNVNLGFEQPTGSSEIWVADFEFK